MHKVMIKQNYPTKKITQRELTYQMPASPIYENRLKISLMHPYPN